MNYSQWPLALDWEATTHAHTQQFGWYDKQNDIVGENSWTILLWQMVMIIIIGSRKILKSGISCIFFASWCLWNIYKYIDTSQGH